mgnify:CR=1 FL=1
MSSGGIWEISDQFQLSSGFDSKAYSLAEDSLGRLYASGDAINSNLVSTSVIRMKRPGSSWITIDKEINNVSEYGGRITPYLTDRVCTTGAKINSEFQYDGILKCLSP